MAGTNSGKPYMLDDFVRYQQGKMSREEEYRLEKRILEDPLTAAAYEGFLLASQDKINTKNASSALSERLADRVRPSRDRVLPLWLYGAAASVLIVLGAFVWIYLAKVPLAKTGENKIAAELPADVASPAESAEEQVEAAAKVAEDPAHSVKQKAPARPAAAASFKKEETIQEEIPVANLGEVTSKPSTDEAGALPAADTIAFFRSGQAPTVTLPARPFSKQEDAGAKKPLASSYPASAPHAVVAESAASRTALAPKAGVPDHDPVPQIGWQKYNTFLYDSTKNASDRGVVTVSFEVSSKGELSGFYALGDKGLFARAIEIITKGPAWSPAIRNGQYISKPVTLTLNFEKK